MKKEYLLQLSDAELEDYAKALNIPLKALKAANNKAEFLNKRWEQAVTITVFDHEFVIYTKRLRDKRFSDLISKPNPSDLEFEQAIELLMGKEQINELYEICTDDDGTVDTAALAVAFTHILNSPELKN